MMLITAFIPPETLEDVEAALAEPGLELVGVSQAVDPREPCPRQRYRGLEYRVPRPRLRLELAVVNEALLEQAIQAIARAAAGAGPRAGSDPRPPRGAILVTTLAQYVPIRALEPGAHADAAGGGRLPPLGLDGMRP